MKTAVHLLTLFCDDMFNLIFACFFLFLLIKYVYKAKTRNDSYQPETQNGHCVGEHVCFQNLTQLLDTKKLGSVSEQVANRCDFCVNWNKICGDRGLIHEKIDTVQDRNTKLFGNQFMSDIQFVLYEKVDDKWPIDANSNEIAQYVVPGHKHILSTASSVFYLMFNGSLPEKQAEIKVTDISAAGFLHMLK